MDSTSGVWFAWAAIGSAAAFGRSTLMPWVNSGAVIMKTISSTSITSIYGTTLMSPMSRRLPLVRAGISAPCPHRRRRGWTGTGRYPGRTTPGIALQNGRQLLHECVVAQFEAARLIGVAVIGHDRRNGGKQADGGGHQRLGDPRRDHRQRRLLHVPERAEGVHDAPDGAKQAHGRAGGADRSKCRQAVLEPLDLLDLRDAHRATRTLQQHVRRHTTLRPKSREFAEAELEDALHAGRAAARLDGAIQGTQIATGPEAVFEAIGVALCTPYHHALAKDD